MTSSSTRQEHEHLTEQEHEHLADHGTTGQTAPDIREHLAACAPCRQQVEQNKLLRNEVNLWLEELADAPNVEPELIDQMVAQAMTHAPDTYSRRAWWISLVAASFAGAAATGWLIVRELPHAWATLQGWSALPTLGAAVVRSVAQAIPGGWFAVGLVALAVVAVLPLLLPHHVKRALAVGALLAAFPWSLSTGHAQSLLLEGEFSDLPKIALEIEDASVDEALGKATEAAGLGYVSHSQTLQKDEDARVSLRLQNIPLDDAVRAILGSRSVHVTRSEGLLIVDDIKEVETASASPPVEAAAEPATEPNPKQHKGDFAELFSFGEDRTVEKGETVRSLVTMGGDTTIHGTVLDNVATMGGDAEVTGTVHGDLVTAGGDATVSGLVEGDVATMGGDVHIKEDGKILGDISVAGGDVKSAGATTHRSKRKSWHDHKKREGSRIGGALHSLVNHVLIFLVGLLMMGVAGGRMAEMKRALAATPLHTLGYGVLAFFGAVALTVALCVTLIGIPLALGVVVVGFVAFFVGLAAVAATLGKVLPIAALQDRPISQLAVGVAVLFLLSIAPLGMLPLIGLATAGIGATFLTRFGTRPYPV